MDYNGVPLVKIVFNFPCDWTVLSVDDIKKIIGLWIVGEERRYPQELGYKGRQLLLEEIKKVFEEA